MTETEARCSETGCHGVTIDGASCIGHVNENVLASYIAELLPDGTLDARGATINEGRCESLAQLVKTSDFTGRSDFRGATFTGYAAFYGAQFTEVDFRAASFIGDASFYEAQFSSLALFEWVQFAGHSSFVKARFAGRASFGGVQFNGDTEFKKAVFSGDTADFGSAEFHRAASFSEAEFGGAAHFLKTEFVGEATFSRAQFSGIAHFGKTKFNSNGVFQAAKFEREAMFYDAQFSHNADFAFAQFRGTCRLVPLRAAALTMDSAVFEGPASTDVLGREISGHFPASVAKRRHAARMCRVNSRMPSRPRAHLWTCRSIFRRPGVDSSR